MNKISKLLVLLSCCAMVSLPISSSAFGWFGIGLGGVTIGGGGNTVGGAVTLPYPKHHPHKEKAPVQQTAAQMPELVEWDTHSPLEKEEQKKVLLLQVYSKDSSTDAEWKDDFIRRIQQQLAYPYYDCKAIQFTMPPSEEMLKAIGDYEKADIVILPVIEKWTYREQPFTLYTPSSSSSDVDPQYEGNIGISIYTYNTKTKSYTKTTKSNYVYGNSYDMPSKKQLWSEAIIKVLKDLPYQRIPVQTVDKTEDKKDNQ